MPPAMFAIAAQVIVVAYTMNIAGERTHSELMPTPFNSRPQAASPMPTMLTRPRPNNHSAHERSSRFIRACSSTRWALLTTSSS
jgi:hypothetical protein